MSKLKFSQILGWLCILLSTSSCSLPHSEQTSVLVIAVENLGVNEVNCNRDNKINLHSGLDMLCEESVRFTHAFTPSILSGPALASILTAQYPAVHGLRHHGRSALSNKIETIAEVAEKKSYATSFFSGGAPILRKHNLQQGFEVFDDNFTPDFTSFFRSLEKTEVLFKNWLQDIGRQAFFSVVYAPDLMFVNQVTVNDFGEPRNLSFESQLEELDETLYSYFHHLKEKKRWDNTLVILVGLNGSPQRRWNELLHTNLFSERSQVALLIKPPYKPRDQGLSWSIDSNVSLADLGTTLWDYIAGETPNSKISELETVSLKKSLETAKTDWNDNRLISVESGWPDWKLNDSNPSKAIRYSLRRGYFVFVHNERARVYNSLIDRLETSPTSLTDPSVSPWAYNTITTLNHMGFKPWAPIKVAEQQHWDFISDSMDPLADIATREKSLREALQKNPNDQIAKNLLLTQILNRGDWVEANKWSEIQKLKDHPCLKVMISKKFQSNDLKLCEDPLALEFLEWFADEKNETVKRKFLRSYYYARIDQKIVETDFYLQGVWDTPQKDVNSLRLLDVLLALPESQKFSQQAQRHISTYQKEFNY